MYLYDLQKRAILPDNNVGLALKVLLQRPEILPPTIQKGFVPWPLNQPFGT
jgi:hypothetical protein